MLQILFSLEDGPVIETVIIPCARGRTTVCVSSQVGCAMNCQFCFTGRFVYLQAISFPPSLSVLILCLLSFFDLCRMGLRKHLSTAEIVEQAVFARRLFSDEFGAITNVVFMVSILFKYLCFVCIPMINWASCVTNSIQFVVYIFFNPDFFPFHSVFLK